ncbi:hypothetical protein A0H81_10245 [Grifola frondosa]|uniref:Uncharacterized protein n=1 Tax=Grifola frondosa TaxID=5627 RepID=A0A1C7LY10_GRIFR|nr:hypothetical protein A0H81_10245 [Grifola frondosa]
MQLGGLSGLSARLHVVDADEDETVGGRSGDDYFDKVLFGRRVSVASDGAAGIGSRMLDSHASSWGAARAEPSKMSRSGSANGQTGKYLFLMVCEVFWVCTVEVKTIERIQTKTTANEVAKINKMVKNI